MAESYSLKKIPLYTLIALTALAFIYKSPVFRRAPENKKAVQGDHVSSPQEKQKTVSDAELTSLQQRIAQREYHITFDKQKGSFQSPNRRNNLRAYYSPGKLIVKNRIDATGHNFRMTLSNVNIYADGQKLSVTSKDTATSVKENTIRINRGSYIEEYQNNESGVRQNFIVQHAPAKTEMLQVRLDVDGMQIKDNQNNKLTFHNTTGTTLTYDSLKCWDAKGKILNATLAYVDNQIAINVDAKNASYPVTIDPIIKNGNPGNADAFLQGSQAGAHFGWDVASAGDVNGDDFSDVIVGAPDYDGQTNNQGAFFLFSGSSNGLNTVSNPITGPVLSEAKFGEHLSTAGDLNNDGFSDVAVRGNNSVFIYFGSSSGLSPAGTILSTSSLNFGESIACAGDINGDGYSDLIVGDRQLGQNNHGAAYIFEGSQTGINLIPSDTLTGIGFGSEYGSAVSGAGDVNGDGYSDVIVGARYFDTQQYVEAGAAYIYHGSATGIEHTAKTLLRGKHAECLFGYSVSTAGDINGDGLSDVLIGAKFYSNGQEHEGAAFIYLAASDGSGIDPQKETKIESGQADACLGEDVAAAGDVNGDGFSDIIVGAPFYLNAANLQGLAMVYYGFKSGINTSQKSIFESNQKGGNLGREVASAGDVNGDGFSDIIIGAPLYDSNSLLDNGMALVFHGSAESVSSSPWSYMDGNQLNAELGHSVSSAGDVNGDGFGDVIVGAPNFDNGQNNEGAAFLYYGNTLGINMQTGTLIELNQANANFGKSVSGAGDVNGDGYDDVIIGAYLYDIAGYTDAGAGFVFYGSASGINLNITNPVYIPQANARAGNSVSAAGDVNADGYDDVVIGVPFYDNAANNAGAAVVSLGSANGIQSGPGTILEGTQSTEEFGNSVSGAGDVNGDGYDDIVIGAYHFENNPNTPNEGGAFVYQGTKNGISPTSNGLLELHKSNAWVGYRVSDAGDVNADGFDDVVVGALYYANGQADEGAAALFYGSSNGIKLNATILEANQASALMGSSVAGGDFNGDGYSDVAVGSIYYSNNQAKEGAVLIYAGSENGISPNVLKVIEGNQTDCEMGISVANAGDVNGDGYTDLIAGAHKYKVSQSANGTARIYYGNGDDNLSLYDRPRNSINLYDEDLVTKLKHHDNIAEQQVGIGLFAKSFIGRSKAKLVWETRAQGQQFSHNSPITNSVQYTGEGSFQDIQNNVELKHLITKAGLNTRLRVRVKFDPVHAITGQIYGPWKYASTSLIYNPGALPVELISFQASVSENQVNLTWNTASEENSDHFEIQRSQDGKDWEEIGSLPAMENSSQPHSYLFADTDFLTGTHYYRLKMVDLDGSFAYSIIRSVNLKPEVSLYPNPVHNVINIKSKKVVYQATIFNSAGTKMLSVTDNSGVRSMDISHLPPGLYLIQIGDETFQIIKK